MFVAFCRVFMRMQAPHLNLINVSIMWLLVRMVRQVCHPTWLTTAGFLKMKSLKLFQLYSRMSSRLLLKGLYKKFRSLR